MFHEMCKHVNQMPVLFQNDRIKPFAVECSMAYKLIVSFHFP